MAGSIIEPMLPASEIAPNPRDHAIIGVFASILLMAALGVAGLLSGWRGVPEPLVLTGVIAIVFSGFITFAAMAVARKPLARRGWPRAATGALWSGAVFAILNAAFWVVAFLAVRARYS